MQRPVFVSRIAYRVSREEKERKKIGKTKAITILFFLKSIPIKCTLTALKIIFTLILNNDRL